MNRQAVAFLTMFSLILMLAVYYVTMPVNEPLIPINEEEPVSGSQLLLDLQTELTSQRNMLSNQYSAILANAQSTSVEKAEAMEQLEYLKHVTNEEAIYSELIRKLGYDQNHIEISKNLMKITILKEGNTIEDASKIIKEILIKSNYQYIPEVSFQST